MNKIDKELKHIKLCMKYSNSCKRCPRYKRCMKEINDYESRGTKYGRRKTS